MLQRLSSCFRVRLGPSVREQQPYCTLPVAMWGWKKGGGPNLEDGRLPLWFVGSGRKAHEPNVVGSLHFRLHRFTECWFERRGAHKTGKRAVDDVEMSKQRAPPNDDRYRARRRIYIGSSGCALNWSQTQLQEAGGVLAIEFSAGASASAASPIQQCPDPFRDYVSVLGTLSSNATACWCTNTGCSKTNLGRLSASIMPSSCHILSVAQLADKPWRFRACSFR